jgi:multidrug efflux pump subunit AcrA (membrane-fusion protein)
MESQSDPTSSPTDDTEANMRRNLGINSASRSDDPLKAARHAIRSQTAAREYAEQQLAQAQNAAQEFRARSRHLHQEREAAINAAQSAIVAKDIAERSARASEAALATERAARARIEGMLKDVEATVRDLREKLATANQTIKSTQIELSAERLAKSSVDDGVGVVPEVDAPIDRDGGLPVVRRPVGRPRKTTIMDTVQTMITPPETPLGIREEAIPPDTDAAVPIIRRPVGRPRKAQGVAKAAKKPTQKVSNRHSNDQEPVQWWIEGWKGR